jgi:hypothetical protein
MTSDGKFARLLGNIRNQPNLRLQDGEPGADIVGWFNFLVRVLLRIRDIQPCAGRVKSRGGEVARFAINLTPFRSISAPEFSNQFKVIQATSSPHPPG